jgi:hypothetical protein
VFYFLFNGSRRQRIVSALWLIPFFPLAYVFPPPWPVSSALLAMLLLAVVTLDPARSAANAPREALGGAKQ